MSPIIAKKIGSKYYFLADSSKPGQSSFTYTETLDLINSNKIVLQNGSLLFIPSNGDFTNEQQIEEGFQFFINRIYDLVQLLTCNMFNNDNPKCIENTNSKNDDLALNVSIYTEIEIKTIKLDVLEKVENENEEIVNKYFPVEINNNNINIQQLIIKHRHEFISEFVTAWANERFVTFDNVPLFIINFICQLITSIYNINIHITSIIPELTIKFIGNNTTKSILALYLNINKFGRNNLSMLYTAFGTIPNNKIGNYVKIIKKENPNEMQDNIFQNHINELKTLTEPRNIRTKYILISNIPILGNADDIIKDVIFVLNKTGLPIDYNDIEKNIIDKTKQFLLYGDKAQYGCIVVKLEVMTNFSDTTEITKGNFPIYSIYKTERRNTTLEEGRGYKNPVTNVFWYLGIMGLSINKKDSIINGQFIGSIRRISCDNSTFNKQISIIENHFKILFPTNAQYICVIQVNQRVREDRASDKGKSQMKKNNESEVSVSVYSINNHNLDQFDSQQLGGLLNNQVKNSQMLYINGMRFFFQPSPVNKFFTNNEYCNINPTAIVTEWINKINLDTIIDRLSVQREVLEKISLIYISDRSNLNNYSAEITGLPVNNIHINFSQRKIIKLLVIIFRKDITPESLNEMIAKQIIMTSLRSDPNVDYTFKSSYPGLIDGSKEYTEQNEHKYKSIIDSLKKATAALHIIKNSNEDPEFIKKNHLFDDNYDYNSEGSNDTEIENISMNYNKTKEHFQTNELQINDPLIFPTLKKNINNTNLLNNNKKEVSTENNVKQLDINKLNINNNYKQNIIKKSNNIESQNNETNQENNNFKVINNEEYLTDLVGELKAQINNLKQQNTIDKNKHDNDINIIINDNKILNSRLNESFSAIRENKKVIDTLSKKSNQLETAINILFENKDKQNNDSEKQNESIINIRRQVNLMINNRSDFKKRPRIPTPIELQQPQIKPPMLSIPFHEDSSMDFQHEDTTNEQETSDILNNISRNEDSNE